MTCFFCKGEMLPGTTTYMKDLGSCIIIIKNVPCNKCTQCGEVSYSGVTIKRIEEIIAELRNSLAESAVVYYSKAA